MFRLLGLATGRVAKQSNKSNAGFSVGVNGHQHCIGDTMLMKSPGGALIVVNAGLSVGDT